MDRKYNKILTNKFIEQARVKIRSDIASSSKMVGKSNIVSSASIRESIDVFVDPVDDIWFEASSNTDIHGELDE
jgi:hypothetical protein